MYYYTDALRIPVTQVALLLLVTRVFDAFADPAIGYAIDRSGGRLVRPLLKWLAIPFGVIALLVLYPGCDGRTMAVGVGLRHLFSVWTHIHVH